AGNISRPVVRPEIRQLSSNKNQLVFYCDIDHVSDISIQYQVTWYRDTFETGSQLMSTTYIKYESSEIFRSRTYLSEALITLGMTIVCSISSIELNIATASEPYFVGFEMISNNSLKLQYSEEALVSIRLTVPFGCQRQNEECFLGVNMFYLETGADNCLLPVAAALSSCGVRISSWRWNQSYAVRLANKHGQNLHSISRTYNIRFRTDERFDHEFFRNYTLPRDIQVEATSNSSSLNGKECHAICDPHMQTFDGRYYENQKEGTYILYTNLKIPVQVQMRTNPCYGFREGPPFCPCGVAIAAGRDVFVVDRCSIPIKIYMPQCDEGILQGKIKSDGNIYQVHLPSGSWVTITSGISFNIYIYPSLSDHMSTSGLCGYLDSEIQNDFMLRNRTTVPENKFEDFNSNWLVKPEEDLFNTSNYLHLPGWPREDYFCICGEFQHGSVSRHDNCSPDSRKFCPESTLNDSLAADCSRKLSTNVRVSVQLDPSDFNVSQSRNDTTMPKRNFTEASANNECWSYLNSSLLFKKCSEVPDIVPESFANTCTKDALITKTMFWAATHLDNAQKKCIYQVTVNQPLPEQIIKDNNVTLNPDEPARNKTTNETEVYTSELLQDLKDMACPMNCTDQGNCSKGQCICWKGYGGNDCSVDLNKAPDVYGIPNRGVCDLHETSCDHASILGSNFADSPNLSCRISLFQVKRTESRFNDSNSIILKAKWISFAEISCPIADVRSKRSIEFPDDLDTLAIGYRVAVGNKREIFGRNISLLILDSLCVDCIKAGFDIACTLKDGYNLVNRRCIKRKPPEEKPESGSIVLIISTVVGSVLAVIVIGVIFLYCRILRRRAKYRKERQETAYEDMQEMEDQRETYSNVDEVYDQITDLSDDYLTAQMTTHTADKSADGQGSYYNLGNTEKNVSEGHAYFQHSQLMNVRQELRNRDFYWRHQYTFPNAQ
ncbi:hypothetical protein ACJMK2_028169, partial [Sinanodonta woodiana]